MKKGFKDFKELKGCFDSDASSKALEGADENSEITYYDNGQIKSKIFDGGGKFWFSNGQLSAEGYRTDSGRYTNTWYKDGQKKSEDFYPKARRTLLDGKLQDKQPPYEYHYTWYGDGEKHREYLYNNIDIYWHNNGQKKYETISEKGCVVTSKWYENGVKKYLQKTCKNELDFLIETYYISGNIESRKTKRTVNSKWQKTEIYIEWWDADGHRIANPKKLSSHGVKNIMDGISRAGY